MTYPNLFRRYLATMLDVVVLWTCIFAASRSALLSASPWAMAAFAAVVVLLYEPLLTTYACTPGQALMGIRVRTFGQLERIRLRDAWIRFAVKYLLGAISVLTIPARQDRRAIHDIATDTIVIGAASLPAAPDRALTLL